MSYMDNEKQKQIFSANLKKYIRLSGKMQKDICADLGINPTTFSMWVKGNSIPTVSVIRRLADYFHIGLTALTDEFPDRSYYADKETADLAERLRTNKELALLFDTAKDAKPEDLETTYQMLLALKRKEKGEDD